jgi:hypothetical protein
MTARLQDYLKPGRFAWSDDYHNSPHANTEGGCIVCGKQTSPAKRITVILTGGGDELVRPEDEERVLADSGYMGHWAVGSECGRAIPQEYRVSS